MMRKLFNLRALASRLLAAFRRGKSVRLRKKPTQDRIPKRVRFRLLVSIPAILVSFTLFACLLTLQVSEGTLRGVFKASGAQNEVLTPAGLILVLVAFSLVGGLMAAYGLTRPLERLILRAETLIHRDLTGSLEIEGANEIGVLTSLFDKVSFSISRFIQDAQILDGLPEGVITFDVQGRITHLNRTAEEFLGHAFSQVSGRPYREVFSDVRENRRFFTLLERSLRGEHIASPSEVQVLLDDDRRDTLWVEFSILRNEQGDQTEVVISFKRGTALQTIKDQIKQTEQLALLGSLAAGMAHEIRNPLGSLQGLTELIQESMPQEDHRRGYTEAMFREVGRLNRLVEDLLNFAQKPVSEPEPMDIPVLLDQVISLSQYRFPQRDIELVKDYQPVLPLLAMDHERLTQALSNLLDNAFQATPEGGRIRVSARVERSSVMIDITNSGSYISPEQGEKIFDAFFTTKERGTGLGLPIARYIISSYGGRIGVESAPESGTTFRITLPVSSQ